MSNVICFIYSRQIKHCVQYITPKAKAKEYMANIMFSIYLLFELLSVKLTKVTEGSIAPYHVKSKPL